MRAEYLIGYACLFLLIGYLIRDLGSLGAAPRSERERTDGRPRSSTAPKNSSRKPW